MGISPLTKIERLQFVGTLSALLAGGWFLIHVITGA